MKQDENMIKDRVLEKGDNYIFLDRIHDQDLLSKLYSLGDVFCLCSTMENFPTTCIEAQCCGTPVVGFDTGGARETAIDAEEIKKETNDRFVPYGNLDALEKKIEEVLKTGIDREMLSQSAKKQYSSERMYRDYLQLYNEVK